MSAVLLGGASLAAQQITRAALDALVQPAVDANWCHGVVVGIVDGSQRLVVGYGQLGADDLRTPDGDTLFEIGSVSKVFTGILLGEGVARGEVTLDDTVSVWLPEAVEFGSNGAPITLHDLSTHHSGLSRMPAHFDLGSLAAEWASYNEARLWALLDGASPDNPPGNYAYSNLGVGLLGSLLGRAGDSDYATLVRERITTPLGMHDTHVWLNEAQLAQLAPPHDADLKRSSRWDMAALAGCGGIRSSVNDMLRFAAFVAGEDTAHESATLDEALQLALRPRRSLGNGLRIGLGWHVTPRTGTWWHNGQTEGYHAMLEVLPDEGRAVVVLANDAGALAEVIAGSIMSRLLGDELVPLDLPAGGTPSEAELTSYTGRYGSKLLGIMELRAEGHDLFAQLVAQPEFRLWPDGPARFRYRVVDGALEFGATDDSLPGEINTLSLFQNGARLDFEKLPSASTDPQAATR